MILIVGLGNPGGKYKNTPHNIGFLIIDSFLKKSTSVRDSVWEENKKFNSVLARLGKDIMLVKPLSSMNVSGQVVLNLIKFYKVPTFGLYVIHDDLDLPLGKIKISFGHGSAGHKGVESIIEKIGGNNFVRVRVGIGTGKKITNPERYVLVDFEESQQAKLGKAVKKAVNALEVILKEGAEKAANRYN